MWTQFWHRDALWFYKFYSILIEADTINTAIKFIQKKYPDKDIYIVDDNLVINQRSYSIINHQDILYLTHAERNVEYFNSNIEEFNRETIFLFKTKKEKINKKKRYFSFKNYLKLPNVEIYYKKDVDAVMENSG